MKKAFDKQGWHFLAILASLILMICIAQTESIFSGDFWGLSTKTWLLIVITIPVVHQIYVVIVWRLELYKQSISKKFGKKGFFYFGIFFMLFLAARPISITFLAISSQESFDLSWPLRWLLTIILGLPSIYLGYSLIKYFGIERALGEDHFKPEEYRRNTLIKEGIFKYTDNGMYLYLYIGPGPNNYRRKLLKMCNLNTTLFNTAKKEVIAILDTV